MADPDDDTEIERDHDDTPERPLRGDADWAAFRYEDWTNRRRFR